MKTIYSNKQTGSETTIQNFENAPYHKPGRLNFCNLKPRPPFRILSPLCFCIRVHSWNKTKIHILPFRYICIKVVTV